MDVHVDITVDGYSVLCVVLLVVVFVVVVAVWQAATQRHSSSAPVHVAVPQLHKMRLPLITLHCVHFPLSVSASSLQPPASPLHRGIVCVHLQANASSVRNNASPTGRRPRRSGPWPIHLCVCLCVCVDVYVRMCAWVSAYAVQHYCFFLEPSSAPIFLNMSSALQPSVSSLTPSVLSSGRAGAGGDCGAAGCETVRPLE